MECSRQRSKQNNAVSKVTASDFAKEAEPGDIPTEMGEQPHPAAVKAITADTGLSTYVTCGQRQNKNIRDFS